MKRITALSPQKRAKDRINVFLDGEFAFGLAAAAATGLTVGITLSDGEIQALQQRDTKENGKQRAIRLIASRPRSIREIKSNLRQKGFGETVVEEIIESLVSVDLIDDEAFARYWVEQRETFRPRSRLAISHELREKGIDRAIIERSLEGLDELTSARRAATKQLHRWKQLPEEQFRLRIGQYLQRRGFEYEIIRQLTNELWRVVSAGDETDLDVATAEGD